MPFFSPITRIGELVPVAFASPDARGALVLEREVEEHVVERRHDALRGRVRGAGGGAGVCSWT